MSRRVSRVGAREGYDHWAATYDRTLNPLVHLDRKHAVRRLSPRPNERILDAGCGTGANLRTIRRSGSDAVGIDFSRGMLRVAQHAVPGARLAQADLDARLPLRGESFDGLLCSLVSEHLKRLDTLFSEAFGVLRGGGRMVFSAFHPELAASGIEANFESDDIEYRLGAEQHSVDDYLNHMDDAGFTELRWSEHSISEDFLEKLPSAAKYRGRPMLLVIEGSRARSTAAVQSATA